jgi:hypothetical protein
VWQEAHENEGFNVISDIPRRKGASVTMRYASTFPKGMGPRVARVSACCIRSAGGGKSIRLRSGNRVVFCCRGFAFPNGRWSWYHERSRDGSHPVVLHASRVNGLDKGHVLSKPVPPTCRRLDRLYSILVKDNG